MASRSSLTSPPWSSEGGCWSRCGASSNRSGASSRGTRPPPPAVAVVEGVVFRVDLQVFPQRILVQRDTRIYTFIVTPDTAITRVDVTTNRGGAIIFDQAGAGALARGPADTAGRAILIRVSVREVTGRID